MKKAPRCLGCGERLEYEETVTLHGEDHHRWVCTNLECEWIALLLPEWHDYEADYQEGSLILSSADWP